MTLVTVLRGEIHFSAAQTTHTESLPQNIQEGSVFPMIHTRNSRESTYLGSAGNFLFTPKIPTSGNYFTLERTLSFQQEMVVSYQLLVFDEPLVESATTSINSHYTPWGKTVAASNFNQIYLQGNYGWTSNMAQIFASNQGSNCESEAPVTTKAQLYSFRFPGDHTSYTMFSFNENPTLLTVPLKNPFYLNDVTAKEGATLDGRDIPIGVYKEGHIEYSCFNATPEAGAIVLSGEIKTTTDAYKVQHLHFTLTGESHTEVLPLPVEAHKSLILANGPQHSYGKVDTWEEEHGDFSATFTPQTDESGNITSLLVQRGERTSMPSATFSVAIITFNSNDQTTPLPLFFEAIMRGLGQGVMKGIR